jgi:hypothetical protein
LKLIIPGRYSFSLRGRAKLGYIKENLLYERLRDGRIIGLLAEDIIESEFSGVTRVAGSGCSSDLIKHDCSPAQRLQCKSYRGHGADLSPSGMKGKGRCFSREDFLKYCQSFEAFLLVDVERFPELVVHAISVQSILGLARISKSSATISRSQLDGFVDSSPAPSG